MRRRTGGQALVEFALTLPIFALVVFVVIQLSLLFIAYYSETRMARETARWLAIHSSTSTDDSLASHVQSTMLPGLVTGTPSVTVGTSYVDATATAGQMHVQYTPCVSNGTVCTHTNRAPGATLYVQMTYDVSNLLFLPSQFGFGSLSVRLPTALPAYRVYVMVE
jgi:Flp pilus assembly protein TadG